MHLFKRWIYNLVFRSNQQCLAWKKETEKIALVLVGFVGTKVMKKQPDSSMFGFKEINWEDYCSMGGFFCVPSLWKNDMILETHNFISIND